MLAISRTMPDGSMEAVISGAAGSKPTTCVFKRQEEK
jgi:hypothetical protein